LKSCCVSQDYYDDERDKTVFLNTTPDLQDQDQDRFFGLRQVRPKTDGLRPHHCSQLSEALSVETTLYVDCTVITLPYLTIRGRRFTA